MPRELGGFTCCRCERGGPGECESAGRQPRRIRKGPVGCVLRMRTRVRGYASEYRSLEFRGS